MLRKIGDLPKLAKSKISLTPTRLTPPQPSALLNALRCSALAR
jgi:hypothetical protein